jgi:hypothetical protein
MNAFLEIFDDRFGGLPSQLESFSGAQAGSLGIGF